MPESTPQHVTFVAHTHWDREWYRPFESFRADLLHVLDDALDRLEADPALSFTLDGQMAVVEDYLEMRPEAEPRIRALVGDGRLHVGPWFTASDTLLVDGEAILRNLAMGLRAAARFGAPMRVGYMPDQFGHAAQVPQILRSVGIDAAVLWRGVGPERPPHAFNWVAPDGSAVKTIWLQDGYATGRRLPSDPQGFADAMERALARLGDWLDGAPMLVPVGDDHVALASWLPAAAAALQQRRPDLTLSVGGIAEHVERLDEPAHRIHGELRSPAHAPVLAGVASARVREKQAAARVASLLVDEVEPLWAWLASRGLTGMTPPTQSIEKAWRHLLHNHAHDSIAGCGADDAHDDVKTRYRWAEQLARAARERALAAIAVDGDGEALAHRAVWHPGPRRERVVVETELPRALFDGASLVSRGADGRKWPVQVLGQAHEPPVFEGEFPSSEIAMYLGGLDPLTPLFGKYLTGIALSDDGPGRVRFDVALGDAPASAAHLAAEQKRVEDVLSRVERIRVVLHAGNVTRKVLLAGGPAPSCGFASIAVEADEPDAGVRAGSDGKSTLFTEGLVVVGEPDGSVRILDGKAAIAVRANDLVSDGDRGDLYHFDAVGEPVRAREARVSVVESGPLRARLRIEQDLDLPVGLTPDRKARASATRTTTVTTEVTIHAGERRVEFASTVDNEVRDHRLRALVHLPLAAERYDVENGLAVVPRPRDASVLGAGNERPASTGQHHLFVDIGDGARGVALMARGLREHELVSSGGTAQLGLTLVRGVGWLARGDLASIDHAAGPMMPTPGAQELGAHRFEYALVLHDGDWQAAGILAEAQRYASPATVFAGRGKARVPAGHGLVETGDDNVRVIASYPTDGGTIVRLLNASGAPHTTSLRAAWELTSATVVDPLEQAVDDAEARIDDVGQVRVTLRPWQIATLRLGR